MAELIVHNPPRAALKASGYIGSPEGDIELTENDKTYNVADFATATTRIPKPPEPTGTKEIIENGVHDVKEYAFADVKIPEPSGTIVLDENNRSYDVTDYAAADVAIPEEEKTVTPSAVKQEITPDNGLLSKVTVLPASLEERTVTPTIVQQTITPEAPAIGLSKVTVGAALPPPILVSKQITENGTYTAADDNADGYSEVTVAVPVPTPVEEKAVNFYDYDGTVLYAYTAQEALALTTLPEAPTHEGLTFQGWNRTLAQLQAYVTDYGIGNAGATYITDDGVTRLYLNVGEDVSLDYELYVRIANGTLSVEVDGVELGSATTTTAGYHTIPFTLPNRGNVRVDLRYTGEVGFHIGQGNLRTRIFGWNSNQNDTLVKVELGNSVTNISNSAFRGCTSINNIVIPNSVTSIGTYAFNGCGSLNNIVIPDSVTSIGSYAFNGCGSLNEYRHLCV